MKGYIEYLVRVNAQLERELERDMKDIEVPYRKDQYYRWLVKKDGKTENAARTYVSYLKSLDNEFFVDEEDFFEQLRDCLEEGKTDALKSLFDHYADVIEEWFECSKKEDIGIDSKKISDWRSGFRSYMRFIMELVGSGNGEPEAGSRGPENDVPEKEGRIPDWEEITDEEIEKAVAKTRGVKVNGDGISRCFNAKKLRSTFRARFVTQDRMGQIKQVFYPIGLLLRLFNEAGESDWLDGWIQASIGSIRMLTERGDVLLSDLDETSSLCIDGVSGDVTVRLKTGEVLQLMTLTHVEGKQSLPMKAYDISQMHIDHTPPISTLLKNMVNELPAMGRLTGIIKHMSEEEGVDIKSQNFCLLERMVMDTCFNDIAGMIPDLKKELELIRSKTELRLMSSVFNLKKKN